MSTKILYRLFYNGKYWTYMVPGVAQRDKGYRTEREAISAAKRAIKRKCNESLNTLSGT